VCTFVINIVLIIIIITTRWCVIYKRLRADAEIELCVRSIETAFCNLCANTYVPPTPYNHSVHPSGTTVRTTGTVVNSVTMDEELVNKKLTIKTILLRRTNSDDENKYRIIFFSTRNDTISDECSAYYYDYIIINPIKQRDRVLCLCYGNLPSICVMRARFVVVCIII